LKTICAACSARPPQYDPTLQTVTFKQSSRVAWWPEYQLRLGRQRQVWLIPIADERVDV